MTTTDEDRLRILLPHWIEHNAEHAAGFRTWVERARATGHEEVGRKIAEAAVHLEQADRALAVALEMLDEQG